ncbi:MAG TPA: pyridoxamine 5'-phosphate oxidase family protein [Pyrinomonadaceae bacterium]|nr:pyridoxamine 5'-phosphate oxidase family protein [Pyrinomonadaceae bacterium]
MNLKGVFLTVVLTLLLAGAPAALAQQTKQSFSREQLITAAREIISTTRYAALITLDSAGRPQARTVDPFPPEKNFIIWIGTNPRTRKVAAIRRNPHVSLYYFDHESQAYVTIRGTARLVNDAETKAKWFKDEWKAFYPDRARDFILIKVTPEQLEIVNVKSGILGDSVKWLPPTVHFGKARLRKLP